MIFWIIIIIFFFFFSFYVPGITGNLGRGSPHSEPFQARVLYTTAEATLVYTVSSTLPVWRQVLVCLFVACLFVAVCFVHCCLFLTACVFTYLYVGWSYRCPSLHLDMVAMVCVIGWCCWKMTALPGTSAAAPPRWDPQSLSVPICTVLFT